MQHQKTSTFLATRNNAARQATLTGAVRLLWPYIWPADRADLKLRVFLAVALMLLSKLFTIAIPYSYKWATDELPASSRSMRVRCRAFSSELRRRLPFMGSCAS